jgi:hypothetical protein
MQRQGTVVIAADVRQACRRIAATSKRDGAVATLAVGGDSGIGNLTL